uniref:Interferon regulatory factor 1 n=1 Tax=Phasianus colchicus TaxID=9054 RepID=A0A669PY78_PHACC
MQLSMAGTWRRMPASSGAGPSIQVCAGFSSCSHVNISSVTISVLAYTSGVTCQRKHRKNFSGVKNYHCNENTQHSSRLFLTGRYKVGEKDPDPKTWKANFRCAMNSLPDIEEVKDKSINKGSSAVRVYRMLPPLTKDQKKERKSKSSREARNKSKRKLYEDMRTEESAERLTSTPLPDDHSSYTAHDYTGQEVEVENTSITLDLSSCEVSGSLTDWRMSNEIVMADSTNDLYQLQVSPLGSSSEDEDEMKSNIIKPFESTQDWHTISVEGKGFFTNEPGTQNMCSTFGYKEQDCEIDMSSGEFHMLDQKSSLDFSWLDTVRPMQAISCSL